MEYTVNRLARLAGVSTRTLRYYDELGLLRPARINSSGYRIYGPAEVDRLQQILLYRELDVSLAGIDLILNSSSYDSVRALRRHLDCLRARRDKLGVLIDTVIKTISEKEGKLSMTDKEKFEGFKDELIRSNEDKYGAEARQRWGNDAVDKSNARVKRMTPADHRRLEVLTAELYETLDRAMDTGDVAGELAQQAARLHKEWLCFFWSEYSPQAHAGLADMYVADPRFTAHYDRSRPGTAEFLRRAIHILTGTV